MRKILVLLVFLCFGVATAEVQSFPEQGFRLQFASPEWKVASHEPELVTFQLGDSSEVLFAVALTPRPETWEELTSEQRQEKAKAALENSSDFRVASLKDREFLGYPGVLMYHDGESDIILRTEGYSLVFTTSRHTYFLTALALFGSELLKPEFAAVLASFQLIEESNEK